MTDPMQSETPPAADRRSPYGAEFFASIRENSYEAGLVVLARLFELARPASVIDVGCGAGGWCAAARDLGVPETVGVDGAYVDRSQLLIAPDCFVAADLSKPLELSRTFDLAICLEVAEHLAPEAGDALVDSLTRLAPIVLFSAAIPAQGGTHHVNEQWPAYWSERFRRRGFTSFDVLRASLWSVEKVPWWYRQNLFLAVAQPALAARHDLAEQLARYPRDVLPLVHPEHYLAVHAANVTIRSAPRALLGLLASAIRTRLFGTFQRR